MDWQFLKMNPYQHIYDPNIPSHGYDGQYYYQQYPQYDYSGQQQHFQYPQHDSSQSSCYQQASETAWSHYHQNSAIGDATTESASVSPPDPTPAPPPAVIAAPPPPPSEHPPPPPPPPSVTAPPPPVVSVVSGPSYEDADGSYSPTAACDSDGEPTEGEVPPPPATHPPPSAPKITLEDIRRREELEKIEHDRRIQAENKRKRKFTGARGAMGGMKKVGLSVFQDMDDDCSDKTLSTGFMFGERDSDDAAALHASSGGEGALSEEEVAVVIKTAMWVAANEDKFDALLQNSKENAKLRFLNEPHSAAGKLFGRELDKIRTQKKVRDICGDDEDMVAPPPPQQAHTAATTPLHSQHAGQVAGASSSGPYSRGDVQAAGREAALRVLQHTQSSGLQAAPSSLSTGAAPATLTGGKGAEGGGRTGEGEGRKEKRRNRWGPALAPPDAAAVGGVVASPALVSTGAASAPAGDARMAAQIREQKELQLIEQRIREAARLQSLLSNSPDDEAVDDPSSSYSQLKTLQRDLIDHYQELAARDDGCRDTVEDAERAMGVIDGGSWEHRKRAKEMLVTAVKNQELTLASRNKHHLSQFLPQEELEKFLNKKSSRSDYGDHKLTEDNVGFQMLERAGWTPGSGLGADGTANVEPVSVSAAAQRPAGAGVGTGSTHIVTENDDDYDSYRKRMMLSYRFRPNPLNNPRRDYY